MNNECEPLEVGISLVYFPYCHSNSHQLGENDFFCFLTCPGFDLELLGKIKPRVTYRAAVLKIESPKVLFTMFLNHLAKYFRGKWQNEGKEKLS